MLYIEAVRGVLAGRMPCSMDVAVKLAALQLLIECCSNISPRLLRARSMELCPTNVATQANLEAWPARVLHEWKQLHLTDAEAEWKYVRMAERLPLYGAEVFGASKTRKDPSKRLPRMQQVAVNASGIVLFEEMSKRVLVTYPFHKVLDICVETSAAEKAELVFLVPPRAEIRLEMPRASEVVGAVKEYQRTRSSQSKTDRAALDEKEIDAVNCGDEVANTIQQLMAGEDDTSMSDLDSEDASLSEISDESEHEYTAKSLRIEYWMQDSKLICQRVQWWQSQCLVEHEKIHRYSQPSLQARSSLTASAMKMWARSNLEYYFYRWDVLVKTVKTKLNEQGFSESSIARTLSALHFLHGRCQGLELQSQGPQGAAARLVCSYLLNLSLFEKNWAFCTWALGGLRVQKCELTATTIEERAKQMSSEQANAIWETNEKEERELSKKQRLLTKELVRLRREHTTMAAVF